MPRVRREGDEGRMVWRPRLSFHHNFYTTPAWVQDSVEIRPDRGEWMVDWVRAPLGQPLPPIPHCLPGCQEGTPPATLTRANYYSHETTHRRRKCSVCGGLHLLPPSMVGSRGERCKFCVGLPASRRLTGEVGPYNWGGWVATLTSRIADVMNERMVSYPLEEAEEVASREFGEVYFASKAVLYRTLTREIPLSREFPTLFPRRCFCAGCER